ncbi:MAG TPA: molybdenum cofactor biosynthesis protein MoaE [Gemmatimonadales bacterium]|jgi:molybdopterin synthase catalytic subunit|nr:molybdenum cofactor biosynthesis protein MoaE [Gemmatimonadales bacterium]
MYLTQDPIDLPSLVAQISRADHGAIVTFTGAVRDSHAGREVTALAYSSYESMAEHESAEVVREAEAKWPVRVALQHRLGNLAIGDVAVAVTVASAHREEAFVACRWVIDQVKARVPIWKRETYADGTVAWVDPTAPGGIVMARPDAGASRG